MLPRVVVFRAVRYRTEVGRLRKRQVLRGLSEVLPCCLLDAIYRVGIERIVDIELHDLVLRVFFRQSPCIEYLPCLPCYRLLVRQERQLGKLLRDRGGTVCLISLREDVVDSDPCHRLHVVSPVRLERPVLDGDIGVPDVLRDVLPLKIRELLVLAADGGNQIPLCIIDLRGRIR